MDMMQALDRQAEEPQRASGDATSIVVKPVPPKENGSTQEAQMFSTVMRVLSQTMNRSLAELGYFPSLGVLVQELQKQNRDFHEATVKLHSDNHTLQRNIESYEQHIHRLQAELDAYKRDFFRMNERLRQITSERDHLVHIVQNNMVNGPQRIPPQPFAPVGPAYANDAPGIHPYGHHRIPMVYNGAPGANPELSSNMPPPGAMPVPMIQNYRMADPGMQPPPGVARQVLTTAIIPSPAVPSSWPELGPSSRSASRRDSESTTATTVGDVTGTTQKSSGLGAIRITPPTQAGRLGTIRILPVQTVDQPSPVPASSQRTGGIIDLTASGDTVTSEEPSRKRRRVTQTVREPVPPAEPPLDLAALGDQLSQLEQNIASPKPQAEAPLPTPTPAPAPEADEQTDDDGDDGDKDADGLVRVDVCIKIAFEKNEEKMWCKMCRFRNAKAVTDEPPVPMPTTQQEDLVKHLEDVHPADPFLNHFLFPHMQHSQRFYTYCTFIILGRPPKYIVLTRYGANFRGLKIEGAQRLGAAGVLIYSDPRDDGSVTVENGYEVYPAGPARNPTSVQRGSVQFLSLYPGDPTTPGYPAYENATRTEGENIPKIPSLPVSWTNAQRLLAEISHDHDARFLTGASSQRKIRLVNHVDDKVMPIWNTMAAIPGHIKNETVLIGCHRDAWVMGAADPTSGTVSLHEVIKGFGTLLRNGWKPLRNIVIASWDAEEYGLIGSTEFAEDFAEWISENVVAYINLDVSVSGSRWSPSASPSLAYLIRQVALEIPHPTDPGKTLWDARSDNGPYAGDADLEAIEVYEKKQRTQSLSTGIYPLGSGSDFTAFLQRLGIASMDQGFSQTPSDAVYHYHSIYDSQRWQELYADPGFYRHVAVAKHLGLVALRLTDAIILPLNTTQYALELDDYLEFVLNDAPSDVAASVEFKGLRHAFKKLQRASHRLDKEKAAAEKQFKELLGKLPKRGTSFFERWSQRVLYMLKGKRDPMREFIKAAKRVQKANAKLVAFEKGFLHEDGIKDREWYRHLIVAPGKWLGYGATPLPSIYDALVYEKNVTRAQHEVKRVQHLLHKMADTIEP